MKLKDTKPLAGWALVEPEAQEEKTSSGIYLSPTITNDFPQAGTIIAIGSEETNEYGTVRKPQFKVGDNMLFKKWGGNEIEIERKKYLFVKFDDFLAKYE